MTGRQQSAPQQMKTDETRGSNQARDAEKTRKVIKDLAETPPVKTMAEVKAASEVLEAAACEHDAPPVERARKKTR